MYYAAGETAGGPQMGLAYHVTQHVLGLDNRTSELACFLNFRKICLKSSLQRAEQHVRYTGWTFSLNLQVLVVFKYEVLHAAVNIYISLLADHIS